MGESSSRVGGGRMCRLQPLCRLAQHGDVYRRCGLPAGKPGENPFNRRRGITNPSVPEQASRSRQAVHLGQECFAARSRPRPDPHGGGQGEDSRHALIQRRSKTQSQLG